MNFDSFQKEQIIPKGIVEIIFNFSDNLKIAAQLDGKELTLPGSFINGYNTAPIEMQVPAQQVFFGIRFKPLAIKKLFGVPAGEFSDLVVDLSLLDPGIQALWEQLAEQPAFDARVLIFCTWLEQRLIDWQPRENLINQFLCDLNQHDLPVDVLAGTLCYSPRQLSRKLTEATGLNTEDILLYKKYLHAVHLIHSSDLSLTEIAAGSHFSDQSHFIRSFKAFTRMTPGDYKRNKSQVKGHLYENVR